MTKYLTKEQILAAPDLKVVDVDVPEWGGIVRVSQITAAARCTLTTLIRDKDGKVLPTAELNRMVTIGLCALAIVDDQGNQLFTEKDIEALGKKSAPALDRVFNIADDLNGVTSTVSEKLRKN